MANGLAAKPLGDIKPYTTQSGLVITFRETTLSYRISCSPHNSSSQSTPVSSKTSGRRRAIQVTRVASRPLCLLFSKQHCSLAQLEAELRSFRKLGSGRCLSVGSESTRGCHQDKSQITNYCHYTVCASTFTHTLMLFPFAVTETLMPAPAVEQEEASAA